MRHRAGRAVQVAVLASLILTVAPHAEAANKGPQHFGSATCQQKIPCSDSTTYMSASDLAAAGNACMVQGLGLNIPDGYFDETAGLDSNGCLTVRSQLLAQKDAKLIMPHCCSMTLPDNSCVLHCDLTNGW